MVRGEIYFVDTLDKHKVIEPLIGNLTAQKMAEVETALGLAHKLGYVSTTEYERISAIATEAGKTLFGLLRKLTDVTTEYPALVRAEATRLRREYLRDHRSRDADLRGLLAGWLADEYRLGRRDEGWRLIEAAYRRGELSAPRVDPVWPAGRKYLTALRTFLVKSGYA